MSVKCNNDKHSIAHQTTEIEGSKGGRVERRGDTHHGYAWSADTEIGPDRRREGADALTADVLARIERAQERI